MMFIDADVSFDPKMVVKFLKADKDVLCGIYAKKKLDFEKIIEEVKSNKNVTPDELQHKTATYPINFLNNDISVDEDGIAEIAEGPTGFMMIKRGVLEKMKKEYSHMEYKVDRDDVPFETAYTLFEFAVDEDTGEYLSEDFTFCRRWRKIGGKIHADLESPLMHHGTFGFKGLVDSIFED